MVFVLLALLAFPLLGLVLFLVKTILKLSFSVGKILLILLGIWFIFCFITGGIQQTLANLGKPYVEQKDDGTVHYVGAFSKGELELAPYAEQNKLVQADVDCALSSVTIHVPENCVVRLNIQAALCQVEIEGDKQFLFAGQREEVLGAGGTIVEVTVRAGVASVRIE